jgi:hypothetical protein
MSEFLGPHGKATVILMKAHFNTELPKLKDLKRILSIPDGRYYKSRGNFYNNIHRLTDLLGIIARIRKTEKTQSDFRSSDFLITVAEVNSNLFMSLQYDAAVIEGFNLTEENFDQLGRLIDNFYDIHSMINSVNYMAKTLEQQRETAVEKGFTDETLLMPDIASLNNMLDGYGDAQLAIIEKSILDWYEANKWKVSASPKKAASDAPEDEAETV